jgi:hypothetical protein
MKTLRVAAGISEKYTNIWVCQIKFERNSLNTQTLEMLLYREQIHHPNFMSITTHFNVCILLSEGISELILKTIIIYYLEILLRGVCLINLFGIRLPTLQ